MMTKHHQKSQKVSFCNENITNVKATLSGSILRTVEIAPFDAGTGRKYYGKSTKKQKTNKNGKYSSNLARSRSKVREHILNNFCDGSIFVTLTYEENLTEENHDIAVDDFMKFIRKVKSRYRNVKYLAVSELQQRGAIHFHIIIDKTYIEKEWLQYIWSNGFIFVKQTYGKPQKLANYISKYITKDCYVGKNRKTYFTSNGLKKSIVVSGLFHAYKFAKFVQTFSKKNEIINEYVHETEYGKYRIVDYYVGSSFTEKFDDVVF